VDVIEGRALARWHALPPQTLAGQPPILQDSGTEAIETLGELMLYDRNLSPNRNEACASCHMPYEGFSGPIPSVNMTMIAYPGTRFLMMRNGGVTQTTREKLSWPQNVNW
jgi:cytochrome c peroxidase